MLSNEKESLGRALTGRGMKKTATGLEMSIFIWLVIIWGYNYLKTLLNCTLKICILHVYYIENYFIDAYIGMVPSPKVLGGRMEDRTMSEGRAGWRGSEDAACERPESFLHGAPPSPRCWQQLLLLCVPRHPHPSLQSVLQHVSNSYHLSWAEFTKGCRKDQRVAGGGGWPSLILCCLKERCI